MSERIKACPFCGSEKVRISDISEPISWWVICPDCYSTGPITRDRDAAILLWNATANQIEALRNKVEVLSKNLIETTDRAMIAEVQRNEARHVARRLYHAQQKNKHVCTASRFEHAGTFRRQQSGLYSRVVERER